MQQCEQGSSRKSLPRNLEYLVWCPLHHCECAWIDSLIDPGKTLLTFVEIPGHDCYLHILIQWDERQLHFELNQSAIKGVMTLKFCTTCWAIFRTNNCTCFSTGCQQAGPVGQGQSIQNAGVTCWFSYTCMTFVLLLICRKMKYYL